MKIIRNGVEIELTAEERRLAYNEQEHEYDIEDVKGELEGRVDGDEDDAAVAQQLLDDSGKLSMIASDKRRNMVHWDAATREAVDDAIAEVMKNERPANRTLRRAEVGQGSPLRPEVGQVYTNRGGGQFRCIAPADNGPMFYNADNGFGNASRVFQNIKTGWTFTAKGVIQYIDGTIEWDRSIDGRFEEVTV